MVMVGLLDIEEAYSKVWRNSLIYKMVAIGIPWKWIKSRTAVPAKRPARQGLPQGSPLSNILFNVYVWDMPNFHITDDTANVATGTTEQTTSTKLRKRLEEMGKYARRWNIKINAGETEVISFTKKIPKQDFIQWENQRLTVRRSGRYLGIHLDGSYGQELWFQESRKAKLTMKRAQTTLARKCSAAPWYIKNKDILGELMLEDIRRYSRVQKIKCDHRQNQSELGRCPSSKMTRKS
ncbi:Reverse transcriptase (RNA-dependent DNA polymerase) [Popillia japonica]|uniref:Reverse transcriptase (RNA-dependent DNA polymerase) n=1 Tax=Popillia japonica TaxID=7064 RepID=A0AAW1JJ98_POPJA